MSYDLWFRPRKKAPSIKAMRAWFEQRPNFFMHPDRAGYENERTGVYFGFDFSEDNERDTLPLAFEINYYRPHVFGLEAEPELTAFVREFDLDVDDPQSEGMGEGPYSPAGFLKGWNAGNHFGYRACLGEESRRPDHVFSLPRAKNAGVWRWNYVYDAAYAHLEDNQDTLPPCFYPTAMLFIDERMQACTGVIWTCDMPIVMPHVDYVITQNPKEKGLIAAPVEAVLLLCEVHSEWTTETELGSERCGMHAWLVEAPSNPDAIISKMKPVKLQRAATDQVLDREWVEEVLR